jgi:hypothetical protein
MHLCLAAMEVQFASIFFDPSPFEQPVVNSQLVAANCNYTMVHHAPGQRICIKNGIAENRKKE